MGPGSHVGFTISAKNKNLVYDHPMNISAKFDSNLFCGFRNQRLPGACNRSHGSKLLSITTQLPDTILVNRLPIGNSRWPP
jgi:hypothetical protein